jgi:hypothetical protein
VTGADTLFMGTAAAADSVWVAPPPALERMSVTAACLTVFGALIACVFVYRLVAAGTRMMRRIE